MFTPFPRLPAELRRLIWAHALPSRRAVEVDMAPFPEELDTYCNMRSTTMRNNGIVRAFAHACSESRAVVLAHGGRLLLGDDGPRTMGGTVPNSHIKDILNPWVLDSDVLHVNWEPYFFVQYDLEDDPIPFYTNRDRSAGFSVAADLQNDYADFDQHLAKANVHLCVKVVTIHATDQQVLSSVPPVFENLASRVQLVSVDDMATMQAMHAHWRRAYDAQSCHGKWRDGEPEEAFLELVGDGDDSAKFREQMDTLIQETASRFPVVVMFRHCADECYMQKEEL
ncbi:hypothetical protein B0I35DRAFT_439811 [Stachybotrys elegans]|uniref:2EXR domain-containing protein n=1 Tax=Stachybotrys elegans TaxID=80388 RepID=A0A8K0SLF2_9HYPO|nr:hypothetical protein B0I35DRAFT_439811 [Stachybotrys elegans]